MTTTATVGIVDFFLSPDSNDPGEALFDISSIDAIDGDSVPVSGKTGFGNFYQQSFVIPANRLTKSWWSTAIQRHGSEATYSDDIVVLGAAFEYPASN